MTIESVEQADEKAQANSEETANETDDLDAILNEFEAESGQEQTTETTQPDTESKAENPSALEKQVKELLQREQDKETRSGIEESLGWAKEVFTEKECKIPEEIDDMFEGFLDIAARKDNRIAQAFLDRHKKPGAWKKVVVAHAQKFAKSLPKASEDSQREEIAAAVALSRGGKKKTGGAEEWLKKSDREFDRDYRRMAGLTQ